MKYETEIENAISKNLQKAEDIFEFTDTPKKDLFNDYYLFCREHLHNLSPELKIDPVVFAFLNGFSSNAIATRKNGTDNGIFVNSSILYASCR